MKQNRIQSKLLYRLLIFEKDNKIEKEYSFQQIVPEQLEYKYATK